LKAKLKCRYILKVVHIYSGAFVWFIQSLETGVLELFFEAVNLYCIWLTDPGWIVENVIESFSG
jgi:hypothetical protein